MASGGNQYAYAQLEPLEDERSLKLKLCLYLESLYAAAEVGAAI